VTLSGSIYGLELELSADIFDTALRGLAESHGVKMVLHEPDMYPLTTTQGVALAAGHWTRVALVGNKVLRQPHPYTSDCYGDWSFAESQGEIPPKVS